MNNKLEIFKNEEFGSVRIIQDGDKYLFCGSDVAKALGYKRTADAITAHCKGVCVLPTPTAGGIQDMKYITEGDVYRLITHSKLPSAECFEKWVFDEVLPTIRKHGAYMTDELLDRIEADKEIISDVTAKMVAERRSHEQTRNALNAALPKVEYYDAFVDERDCTNIRATAKELEIPERVFCKFLMDKKLVYRAPSKNLMPYQKPFNTGLFIVRDYYRHNHKGCYTLFTSKGKDYIRKLWARENSKCA
ncbi:MAG TPA: phage antirepressor KilAC domain-containing protein [Clostridia bacterium]|nr:phage antirepressor KilAC domain-containing protein [Clostridia bacterium]